jgi:hypothetical protein
MITGGGGGGTEAKIVLITPEAKKTPIVSKNDFCILIEVLIIILY